MSKEIKINTCSQCPLLQHDYSYYYTCLANTFSSLHGYSDQFEIEKSIHCECPFKNNDTLTYKFIKDEPRD